MPRTRGGVYHNLRESKYTVSNSEIVFFFSSKIYLNKFMMDYQENREKFRKRMNQLIKDNPYNVDVLADIKLYTTCEKRGFFVRLKGAKIDWRGLHQYALRKMTERNTLDWYETQGQKSEERKRTMV